MHSSILILGGGNMGGALARCWQQARVGTVHVIERDAERRAGLVALGLRCHASLTEAPHNASLVMLAIKPQQFASLQEEIRGVVGDAVLLSIMAGVSLSVLHGLSPRAVRVMPNLPALIGESMSVGYAPSLADEARALVEKLFAAAGQFAWLEHEEQLHVATAISGSGPGYVFAFMEALEKAALVEGLSPELARQLVQQTFRGAGMLAAQSHDGPTVLRQQVTSPGGTTEAALAQFTEGGLSRVVLEAVAAAIARSKALAG